MAFDGNGNWVSNFSAVSDRDNGYKILASRFDGIFIADLQQSFENCLTKDMQIKPQANFDANNNRIIDVADPVNDTDAVNKQSLSSAISTLLGSLYPVGSVYIGTQASCPMASLISGSTWELVSAGKALWTGNGTSGSGTTANNSYANAAANTTIAAGLPNITGNAALIGKSDAGVSPTSVSGALQVGSSYSGNKNLGGVDSSGTMRKLNVNASSSNSTYGTSSTVQPPAYVVNVWRRTA